MEAHKEALRLTDQCGSEFFCKARLAGQRDCASHATTLDGSFGLSIPENSQNANNQMDVRTKVLEEVESKMM